MKCSPAILTWSFFLQLGLFPKVSAQMIDGTDTLYGNEWINYGLSYYKIPVGQDGVYRITFEELEQAGIPVSQIHASTFRLYCRGKEQNLFIPTSGTFLQQTDEIFFYGQKNRSEVDRFLFANSRSELFNPDFGLTSDTIAYFLTWTPGEDSPFRYEFIDPNQSGESHPRRTFYVHREKLILNEKLFKPTVNTQHVRFSHYVRGEGFGSAESGDMSFSIGSHQISSDGPKPNLRIRVSGSTQPRPHEFTLKWNSKTLGTYDFPGTSGDGEGSLFLNSISLDLSDLVDSNRVQFLTDSKEDKISIGSLELIYPRFFIFSGTSSFSFSIEDARQGAAMEFKGFTDGRSYMLMDLSSSQIQLFNSVKGAYDLQLRSGPANRNLVLADRQTGVLNAVIKPSEIMPIDLSQNNYILITHPDLRLNESGEDVIAQYADYRQSAEGGNYRVKTIFIQELIDQYAYGVPQHPLSIKNFVNYLTRRWPNAEYLFLIGKGLQYDLIRKKSSDLHFLPVYGLPGSDNLLSSTHHQTTPRLAIGRLAARNAQQVAVYLEKLKVMERQIHTAPQTIEARAWMKRVLHLGGGVGQSEVNVLSNKLSEMGEIAETGKLLNEVSSWSIESQDIIDPNSDQSVIDLINSGLILKTFFGHGSVTTTQFNGFEDPQFLNNRDRYPVMMSLGCLTGNLFTTEVSLGESNILASGKGASIYMATSGLGFLSALDVFGKSWYSLATNQDLRESVGKITKKVLALHENNLTVPVRTLMQQLILHGDPAFKMNISSGPDYLPDGRSLTFHPSIIRTNLDSFEVSFQIYNLGIKDAGLVPLEIYHTLPNGQKILIHTSKKLIDQFVTQLRITLPLLKEFSLEGPNLLQVELNADRSISELPDPAAFQNNSFQEGNQMQGIAMPIVPNGVNLLHPYPFAIVIKENPDLVASTSDPLESEHDYIFQLDTTNLFNSTLLREFRLRQKGGLLTWNTSGLPWNPSTTYYWRVSPDSSSEQGYLWSNSSFTFLLGSSPGWNQSHYFQFLDGNFEGLDINNQRKFTYKKSFNEYRIFNVREDDTRFLEFFFDGQQFGSPLGSPLKAGFSIIIVNPVNQSWYINQGGSHGSILIPGEPNLFVYDVSQPQARNDLGDFLKNIVPDGFYVLLYAHLKDTISSFHPETWAMDSLIYGENLFQVFESLGAKKIRLLAEKGTVPYNFFFQKNGPVLAEDLAESGRESILSSALTGYLNTRGSYSSTIIGPAKNWENLDWDFEYSSNPTADEFSLSLSGLDNPSGNPVQLFPNILEGKLDLTQISTSQFPYLQLKIFSKDSQERSSPNLNKWNVTFEPVPEISFNTNHFFRFENDTSVIGDPIKIAFAVTNVSESDLDSITVSYQILDSQNKTVRYNQKYAPLTAGSTTILDFSFSTDKLPPGNQLFFIQLNPGQEQLEFYPENNTLIKRFHLLGDQINPVLDVTFDGVHIMNGDIVSPSPLIRIRLDDENKSLLLTDSSLFQITLKHPDNRSEILQVSDPDLQFTPATTAENVALMEIQKSFPVDGLYELSVQGKDVSGNLSGKNRLVISFNVINKLSAARTLPYPNPFTTSTRFLYTITGSVPEIFFIRIYTVDGSLVRELDLRNMENLKVGTHLTEYQWDGTDEFGDRLANGVYLYQTIIRDKENQTYELLDRVSESYFEKNMGKIVIVR